MIFFSLALWGRGGEREDFGCIFQEMPYDCFKEVCDEALSLTLSQRERRQK